MILVTGGTGNLGTQLVPLLIRRGHSVRVLTRDPERTRARLAETADVTLGDVRSPDTLGDAVRGADAVVSAMTGFGPGAHGPKAIDYQGNLIQAGTPVELPRFPGPMYGFFTMVGAPARGYRGQTRRSPPSSGAPGLLHGIRGLGGRASRSGSPPRSSRPALRGVPGRG
jgi:NADPH:quinone reductase-like Zn-dependent oxidoreductase